MPQASDLAFSESEYDRRLAAVRAIAEQESLPVLLFFNPSSICYLSGFSTINLWDVTCLIVTQKHEPLLVMRAFEKERFQASCRFQSNIAYGPEATIGPSILKALRDLDAESGSIGLEMGKHLDLATFEDLRSGLQHRKFSNCASFLQNIRLVKSPEEVEVLRRAAAITDAGVEAAQAAVRIGASDYEIGGELSRALLSRGSDFMCIQPVVAVGVRSGMAHSTASGVRVQEGDPVFLELGACVSRYTTPIMRTVFAGPPSPELRELSEYSSQTSDAMIGAMHPGATASEVAATGHRALEPILSKIAFHFVWGYPVGIGFPPSWLEETGFFLQSNNSRQLQPGMVFHLPLMLRVPGMYGAGYSETVLITENGAEILSQLPRKIQQW